MQQTAPQAYLIIQPGSRWTDILRLHRTPVGIGRASDNQIVVRDERVSRHHATIVPQTTGWVVRDLGSRNGTQVGEHTIQGEHRLQDGETIAVGGCRITFSHSLSSGFAASRQLAADRRETAAQAEQGQATHDLATQELGPLPAIVQRRSQSQWSSGMPAAPQAAHDPARWNFFYRLVAELVGCDSPEQAAHVALAHLLEQLGIAAGGVIWLEATAGSAPASGADDLPRLAVLATRQPDGESYHRISDFLVRSMLRDQQAILARNVMDDSKLSLARASARRGVLSVICAPLRCRNSESDRLLGFIHVYSAGEERMLTDGDLDLTVGVADNLAIALSRQAATAELNQSLASSRRHIDQLQQQLEQTTEMVGHSPAITRVRDEIRRAAPSDATVLIRGESGVGKELVARAIHRHSPRRDGPLVCLNCAALAPSLLESELFGHEKGAFTGATERKLGKFEAADGGTLLLDEIGEMPPELQAKFLRVIEGHPFERLGSHRPIRVNVRVLAATNRDLEHAVAAKEFRADLYYRLRVIEIRVPPLRQRLGDVPILVEHFLQQLRSHASRRLSGIEPQALETLCRHRWPGNIRELRNVLERAVVLGNHATIGIDDLHLSALAQLPADGAETAATTTTGQLPPASEPPPAFEPLPLAEIERRHILATLEACGGNKSKTAHSLGIERSTLDRKLKRYERSPANSPSAAAGGNTSNRG